jgi:beta-glucosidase
MIRVWQSNQKVQKHLLVKYRLISLLLLFLFSAVGCGGDKTGKPSSTSPPPPGFFWGTATAAHQVEGYNTQNDWYLWEMMPGKIKNGDISGIADDHYHRFDQDFALAEQMGHNAYRFSIEWSRIEPARGRYDPEAIAHYHEVLASLRRHGLVPFVTLHHFTHPQWILNPLRPDKDLDGWQSEETVKEFVTFAGDMAKEFGREIDYWSTINEPEVLVNGQYFMGGYPSDVGPFHLEEGRKAIFNLYKAHAAAYHAIHENDLWDADGDRNPCMVSSAKHIRIMAPKNPRNLWDQEGAAQVDYVFNQLFFDVLVEGYVDADLDGDYDDPNTDPPEGYHPELANTLDYIAINYYSRDVVTGLPFIPYLHGIPEDNPDPSVEHNDMGWEIYPQGFYETLKRFGSYGLPVIVTENGIPYADPDQQPKFIVDHLDAMFKAMEEGVDVRGYLYWSLMDNFEWAEGFWPRFGLLAVDYSTLVRTPRPSAALYTEIIRTGEITEEMRRR